MSALNSEQLPILAGALLRLRGLTLAAVFDATGIRVANLSAWLKGKPQVISAARVTALLYHLGVQGGQLRSDMVHTWSDQGEWAHLRSVFNLLQEPVAPRCLFLDEHPGMSHTRFLQWGEAWVRLSLTPGPTAQDDLAAMVSPDRMIVLPHILVKSLCTPDLQPATLSPSAPHAASEHHSSRPRSAHARSWPYRHTSSALVFKAPHLAMPPSTPASMAARP